jgi:TP901 family phage tail tape measure protein
MAGLPAVVQEFGVSAANFLAGIDAMLERTDKLAASLDAAAAAADRLSGVADGTGAAADRLAAAEEAAEARAVYLADAMDRVVAGLDANAAASDRAMAATDALAASYDRAGESATVAGDRAAGASGKAAGFGSVMKTALLGVGIAAVYGIDKSAKFQSSITQLHTQAGVAQSKLAGLSQGVLQLAAQTGEGPQSLAESLYHVASNMASLGASGPKMMSAVKIAAEGAQVGGADLVDVTNALTAAIASGIPGVQNFQQAMGMLNAAVGSGDMHMQDLADAFSSGLLAVIKGYGVTLKDTAAALAVFGDNNIRGAKAGTDLRMAVQSLAVQGPSAGKELAALGLGSKTLANDMKSGGLMKALDDLTGRFKKNGIAAKDQGEVITTLFGKKAGSGIAVLLEQMDRLKSKYPAITAGADKFAGDWADRQKTMAQQWDDLKSGAQALAVSFGTILLPAATKIVGMLARFGAFLEQHPAVAAFAGALLALAAGFKIAATMASVFEAATSEAGLIFLAVAAVAALAYGLYELYRHSKLVRDIVADVGKFFAGAWHLAMEAAGAVIKWFTAGPLAFIKQQLAVFSAFWAQHGAQIEQIAKAVWGVIRDIIVTYWRIIWDGTIRPGLVILQALWRVAWGLIRDTVRLVWNMIAVDVRTAVKIVLDVISLALDLLTGKWGAAWNDLKKLASDALHGAIAIITTMTSGFGHLLWDAGVNLVKGLIGGIKSMIGAVGSAVSDLGHGVVGVAKDIWKMASPSKVFYELGGWITRGLANGIAETAQQAIDKSRQLAADVKQAYLKGQITAAEAAELWQRVASALTSREDTLVKTMKKIGLEMAAGMLSSLENATSASTAKTAVNKLISYVQQAWAAGDISTSKASSMTKWLEADSTRLQGLATRRQALLATIKAADAYAATTTSNTESWAGLSNVASSTTSGGMTYSGNLLAGMQANLAAIRQFGAAVKKLAHMGLRKDLLNQIIQMGPAQGLQVANALIDGPAKVIAEMDATQAQIVSGSTALGQAAANAMYDTGKSAGKGFLSGLQAQEGQLDKMMQRLAKSWTETVRRELGTGGGGGAGSGMQVHVAVNGFVGSNAELSEEIRKVLQQEVLRYNRRNGKNGLNL